MRKDGKSQYTIKKEKLLKIKKILEESPARQLRFISWDEKDQDLTNLLFTIWEIVKDEK